MLPAHFLENAESVATRQHDIEHDDVVGARQNPLQRRAAIVQQIDHEILFDQAFAQKGGELLFILDYQRPHQDEFRRQDDREREPATQITNL